jgi:integrase/recombinase XerD
VFRPFKAAVLRAEVAKNLRIHDLRHTFAGLFLASGGDIFKLSKILGHSSVAITQQVYAHLHPDAVRRGLQPRRLRDASQGW